MKHVILTGALAFMLAGPTQAATLQIAPTGVTTVAVTADLGGLGLGGAPTGTATLDVVGGSAVFSFNITGGTVAMDGNAVINHDGSGVSLFALADTSIAASVGNFVIDTLQGGVFGNVGSSTDLTRLFDIGTAGSSGIPLNISADLAGALTSVFGAPDLSGAQFGLAITAPQTVAAVPLPAGMPLLVAGLAALGLASRRRKSA